MTQSELLRDYIVTSKYARHNAEAHRRETLNEIVDRVEEMHAKRWPEYAEEIRKAFFLVRDLRVMPSMRSMQFAGPSIESNHTRMYNCSATAMNRPRAFAELFYCLLCGTGTGFSVQRQHVGELPSVKRMFGVDDVSTKRRWEIQDSIEGWADAIDKLVGSALNLHDSETVFIPIHFDFSKIRPKGSPLHTSGGFAPGPEPLRKAIENVRSILIGAAGRQLRPIEVYDICMFLSQAVLSGGIRRSASVCLFSPEDVEMCVAKTGDWFKTSPQRSFSNNSAVFNRQDNDRDGFHDCIVQARQFGEPGFFFTNNPDYLSNPCMEIGLHPFLEGEPGWQMCNLTTVNGAKCADETEFREAIKVAAFIGTLQAAYTDFPYLGSVTEQITRRESLLGVSIAGFMDRPGLLLDPKVLERGAELAKWTNWFWAERLGISAAARVTTVKPDGTVALVLGSASGIHPHHAERYFRRVQVNRSEGPYQHFRRVNAFMTEKSVYAPDTDDIVTFALEAPEGAKLRKDIIASDFLRQVKLVYDNWVLPGTASQKHSPGLTHNVSNTVTIASELGWTLVEQYIWDHRNSFAGVSLLGADGDKKYAQAPREEVTSVLDRKVWQEIQDHAEPVDYADMTELRDTTNHELEPACAGGVCEI